MRFRSLIYRNSWLVCLLLLLWAYVPSAHAAEYAAESALATGKWVKVQVAESGIFQLTQAQLAGWGFSDMSKVKVFGYGGAMISETMGDGYVDDLPQIPVYRTGQKILFYAQGPVSWRENPSGTPHYLHVLNPYAEAGCYFITDKDVPTSEMIETGAAANAAARPQITTFAERVYYENELSAPGTTGRTLAGEDFRYNTSQTFPFELTGKTDNSDVAMQVRFLSKVTGGSGNVRVMSGNTMVASGQISGFSTDDSYGICRSATFSGRSAGSGENLALTVAFSYTGILYAANLDYITLNYTRKLELDEPSLQFRSWTTECNDSVFSIKGAQEGLAVWDVTESYAPLSVKIATEGSVAYFRQTEQGIREYVAFNPSANFPSPSFVENVQNQNWHGAETPTMLIITPLEFKSEAERIASLHRDQDGMKVAVVTQNEIFNEFSSGTPDAMAYRKIAKMWYDRSANRPSNSVEKFRYMLLFGRSIFDNGKTTGKSVGYPTLLTWESDDFASGTLLSESSSYNSDDAFGTLQDGSDISRSKNFSLDIGIGRMPVKSLSEAKAMVDKLYSYVLTPDMDSWKNNVLMIADDGDNGVHMIDSDTSIDLMKKNGGSQYIYDRVYIDAFNAESSGAGRTYPQAREKMFRSFKEGVLFANYLGHANPQSWTHNGLLRWQDIEDEFYYKHYPLLYTGTCEFTRWDSPEVSGGEVLYLNEQGGMIAMITSSRVTGITSNGLLSNAVCRFVFQPDAWGEMRRLGDILKDAKNTRLTDSGHRWKYVLLGDPAMRLKYPKYRSVIDEINGEAPDENNAPEVMARQLVTVKGHIEDMDGVRIDDFKGLVKTTVYDSETSVVTHGNAESDGEGLEYPFEERSNLLYKGTDSVEAGEYTVSFRIPAEINNNYTPALISTYAYSSDSGKDANGSTENLYVYGYDESAIEDTTGPEIKMFVLNSESFKDGDAVNETPYMMAQIYDESGINLSSAGIGHEMTLLLDGKTTITGLDVYYSQDIDKNGYLNFQMDELQDGNHTLRLRVWDTNGNLSEKEISFFVVHGMAPELYSVYTDANPAKTSANFYLKHNRPDAMVTVTISVYNQMGQSVWSKTQTGRSDMFLSMPITWDLTDGTGRRVGRGIYLYKAAISSGGGSETTKAQRIAVASE